jgi:hypothetical protein
MGAVRGAAVDQGLHRAVRQRAHQVAERGTERPQRRRRPQALGDVSRPHEQQAECWRAVVLGGQERHRRRAMGRDHHPELVGRLRRELAQEPQQVRACSSGQ